MHNTYTNYTCAALSTSLHSTNSSLSAQSKYLMFQMMSTSTLGKLSTVKHDYTTGLRAQTRLRTLQSCGHKHDYTTELRAPNTTQPHLQLEKSKRQVQGLLIEGIKTMLPTHLRTSPTPPQFHVSSGISICIRTTVTTLCNQKVYMLPQQTTRDTRELQVIHKKYKRHYKSLKIPVIHRDSGWDALAATPSYQSDASQRPSC